MNWSSRVLRRSSTLTLLLIVVIALTSCGPANAAEQGGTQGGSSAPQAEPTALAPAPAATSPSDPPAAQPTAAGAQPNQKLTKVRMAMSAFQDVNSVWVGVEKGFYRDEGIELEIQLTDWPGAQELLVGGHVELANAADDNIVVQNAQGQDTTMAFPLFYFAGAALMYDPQKYADWRTFDDFMQQSNDRKTAMRQTLEQIKGKRIGLSTGSGDYATFVALIDYAGLQVTDFTLVDLAQEEQPPALISGSLDIMIGGIPQRLAVQKEGYKPLLDQTALPGTITHAGFAAHRKWVDENPELAARIQKVIFRTLDYIEKNPDDAFPIIAKHLQSAGTAVDTERLKDVWNHMEFFMPSKEAYVRDVATPGGRFYWKDRYQTTVDTLKKQGQISDLKVPLEDLNYGLKVVDSIK